MCTAAQAAPDSGAVPASLAFEVRRNGVAIGTHCVAFAREDSRLRVDVAMDLEVPIALWFDYRYRYSATEWWQSGRLDALRVEIEDGGDRLRIDGRTRDGRLEIDGPQGLLRLTRDLMPSNHWNVAILQQNELLNTLTGGTSALDIKYEGRDRIPLEGGEVDADRYRLGGDLSDTRVWYDPRGQWRGLEFAARDGSTVRLYPRGRAAVSAQTTTETLWSRNPVCKNLSGPLSG
ncbi:DUF6134 family protein [Marinobacterium rhizophilum]|uniref:YD repeat-containing protein n=1 Tax=Marinobacterium rhizophilum TaxID=420402 RepID=A0ABY5HJ78_9GAMM|nr:DUF6134 family protein [Marinobacterium rhizophilum]UTW12435.1 hypothetical protein KDW95_01755 [Marinobacterium rhizophilum]